jgi:hypothetical protein
MEKTYAALLQLFCFHVRKNRRLILQALPSERVGRPDSNPEIEPNHGLSQVKCEMRMKYYRIHNNGYGEQIGKKESF